MGFLRSCVRVATPSFVTGSTCLMSSECWTSPPTSWPPWVGGEGTNLFIQGLGLRKSPFTFCVTLMYIKAGTVKAKSKKITVSNLQGSENGNIFLWYFYPNFYPVHFLSLYKCYFELFFLLEREIFQTQVVFLEENNDPGNERMKFESVKWTVGVMVPVATLSHGTGSTCLLTDATPS